jgi:excisionase family DNA binding protein
MTNTTKTEPLAVSPREAMELVSIKNTKLYELIRSGELRSTRIGTRRLIDYQSLKRLAGLE